MGWWLALQQIPIRKVRPGGGGCVVDRVAGLTMATATKQQQIRSSGQRNAGSAGRVNGGRAVLWVQHQAIGYTCVVSQVTFQLLKINIEAFRFAFVY